MNWDDLFALCESPIEETLARGFSRWPDCVPRESPCTAIAFRDAEVGGFRLLYAQHPVGRFRADFLLVAPNCQPLVVECDGHQFHTGMDSWERDAERDKAMRNAGYNVVRFGGWRIKNDLLECLRIIDLTLQGKL